jgi:DNA repair protein RecO (recombination protein O)
VWHDHAVKRIDSDALVVRTVELGEADVIATLVTERIGKVSAIVRGARRGSRRLGGALEPMHTIAVMLEDKGGELTTLKEARIVRLRSGLAASLDALGAAGSALRWARHLFPPRTPEPEGWRVLTDLLDVLDRDPRAPRKELARAGLRLLSAVGYGLELQRCVMCGRPCPESKPAYIDPARGGLICRGCGGARSVLSAQHLAAARALLASAAPGEAGETSEEEADVVLAVVDRALAAHAGLEPRAEPSSDPRLWGHPRAGASR